MDQPSTARWRAFIAPTLAVVIIAAGLFVVPNLVSKTETPPVAEPAPVATQSVEQPTPAETIPAPASTRTPTPTPTATASSSVPAPKYQRDDLNILGKSIWDAFGEDVVLVNSGIQTQDANWNTKVVRPFDPSAALDDEKPLNIEGSKWVVRVTETDAKKGTIWSVIT